MPLVRITPPGRPAKLFRVAEIPRTWDIDGGCATASVPIILTDEDAERIALSRVEVFGALGMDWSGFAWRRPRVGGPIECAGQALGLTLAPRERHYADTSLTFVEYNGYQWGDVTRSVNGGTVELGLTQATHLANTTAGYSRWYDVPMSSLSFTAFTAYTQMTLEIWTSATPGALTTRVYNKTTTGTVTGVTVNLAGAHGYVIRAFIPSSWATTGSGTLASIASLVAYQLATTAPTPATVITDCLDALPTWVLPAGAAYRALVGTDTTVITSLDFPDKKHVDKEAIDAVLKMTSKHFGFYPRWVGGLKSGVPVFAPISTTPDFILDVRATESDSLQERGVDGMANRYDVAYTDVDDVARVAIVSDSSPNNYLNTIGYIKHASVDASWTTSPTQAGYAGTAAAANALSQDAEGTVTIHRARLSNGRACSPLMIMPGSMARVLGMGAPRKLTVRSCGVAQGGGFEVAYARPDLDLKYLASQVKR